MRIVVPYTTLNPLTARSLATEAVEYVDVSQSLESYWRLVDSLWSAGESFLLVEHDMEVNPRALRQAKHCKCEWGVSPYIGPGHVMLDGALGCTRFRAGLMRNFPDLLSRVALFNDSPHFLQKDWRRLDARMKGLLMQEGYSPHLHAEVKHHHVYQGRCACGEEHG